MQKKSIIVAVVLLGTFLAGEIGPRLAIGHNIEKFYGPQQAFAASAWSQARLFFSGSAEPLFWTAIQVQDVTERDETENQKCYEVTVRAYTLFGLPWSAVLVSSCNGGSIVRQRWGLFSLVTGFP